MRNLFETLSPAAKRRATYPDEYWDQVVLSLHADDGDPYFNSVVLGMHMDGAENGTTFTDIKGKATTANGNVATKTATKQFGTSSAYFDGSGDYISLADSEDWNFGSSDFTIECWIYINTLPGTNNWPGIVTQRVNSTTDHSFSVYLDQNNGLGVSFNNNSVGSGITYTFSTSQWYHIAISKTGTNMYMSINGVVTTAAGMPATINNSSTNLAIGSLHSAGAFFFNGYIDDVRITKGVARYTSNFSVPAQAFPNYLTDDKKGHTTSSFGNSTLSGSVKKFGNSSLYLDGTGDYITSPNSADWNLAGNDFCIEGWIYPLGTPASSWGIVSKQRGVAAYGEYLLFINSSNQLGFAATTGGEQTTGWNLISISGGTVTTSSWSHVAITREASIFRLFLNGALITSGTATGSITTNTASLSIGSAKDDGQFAFNGYIDDLRVTKGVARYTLDFSNQLDPYWGNVVLAMHMDGADNGTTFTDLKGSSITAAGNVATKTATKQFGTSSAYFDGTGDHIIVPNSTNFDLASSDFTIETWFYANSLPSTADTYDFIVSRDNVASTRGWSLLLDQNDGKLTFVGWTSNTTSSILADSIPFPLSSWTHIAVSRVGSSIRLFKNGTLVSSNLTFSGTIQNSNVNLILGSNHQAGVVDTTGNWNAHGYIDDLRITKGVGRYTSANNDPYWSNNTLLLNMDGAHGGADFKELTTGKTVTRNGNAITSTAQKVYGVSSAYFDGTGDYLNVTGTALGTSDFTIEGWIYSNDYSAAFPLFDSRTSDSDVDGLLFYVRATGVLRVLTGNPAVGTEGTTTVATSVWHHIALTRSSGVFRGWLDGVEQFSVANSANLSRTSWRIGHVYTGTGTLSAGYIDDMRVTNGVARYTSEFTPPTLPHPIPNFQVPTQAFPDPNFPYGKFTKPTQDNGAVVDPYWNNVALAMHMEGAHNGTVFHDEKGATASVEGNVVTSTTQKKFGNSSAVFDGATDAIAIPTTGNTLFDFGTGDFCIDLWCYFTGDTSVDRFILSKYTTWTSDADFALRVNSSHGFLRFFAGDSLPLALLSSSPLTTSAWNHIAVTRTSGLSKMFINGVQQVVAHSGSVTIPNGATTLRIGNYSVSSTEGFVGYLDDLRITKGTSRFEPTTTDQYYSNVVLQMSMDGPNSGTVFGDLKGKVITAVGNVVTSTAQKKYGYSSAYFDGTGDYLSSSFDINTQTSLTIECWVYLSSMTNPNAIFFCGDLGSNANRTQLIIQTTGSIVLYVEDGSASPGSNATSATGVITTGTFYHVAATVRSGNLYVYVNGVQVATGVKSMNATAGANSYIGTCRQSSVQQYFNGYIDDFRITSGVDRYTANFTPAQNPVPNFAVPTKMFPRS